LCVPRTGTTGCYPKAPNGSPLNTSICDNPNGIQGDMWYASPNDCPDSCADSYNNNGCQACVMDSNCGWCIGGGGCRTGNAAGVWNSGIMGCNTTLQQWRYGYGPNKNLSSIELCSMYAPCSSYKTCDICSGNYQGIGQSCVWCLSANPTDTHQGCFPLTQNFTCAAQGFPANTAVTSNTQCPKQPSNSVVVSINLGLLALALLFASML